MSARASQEQWPCPHCDGTGTVVSQYDRHRASIRFDARRQRRQAETGAVATKAGQQWTVPEMEMALRTDLTVKEIALLLGRTYQAVSVMRHKCRTEPKFINAIGAPEAAQDGAA